MGPRDDWFKAVFGRITDFAREGKKLGQDDPRKIVHSVKVGLAITLVSLFYYFEPLYDGFGVAAMWAVLTVVVVFEFSVGATLGKGILRGIATFLGGILGVGAHSLANFSGHIWEPILLGMFIFILAAAATFIRFFPKLKARFDYGLLIFLLTFCLITVSGYRDDEVVEMAHERLSTILIGGATSVAVCVFICPVWAGDDLHKSVASNMDKLAIFLQGFGIEYFNASEQPATEKNASLQGYRSVLHSRNTEESLVNFAKWEPRHGRFRYRHPWGQYLKIGSLTRQCAYHIEMLNIHLNSSIKTPMEIRGKIRELGMKISLGCSSTLKELAISMETMTRSSSADAHFSSSKMASKDLKSLLKTDPWRQVNLLEVIPAATVASLLIDVVSCTEKIVGAVHELASLAHFKTLVNVEEEAAATTKPEEPGFSEQKSNDSGSGNDQRTDDYVIKIPESAAE